MGGLALGAIVGLLISNFFAPDAKGAAALAATLPFAAMLLAGIHAALAIWISAAHRAGLFAENILLVSARPMPPDKCWRAPKNPATRASLQSLTIASLARPHKLAQRQ